MNLTNNVLSTITIFLVILCSIFLCVIVYMYRKIQQLKFHSECQPKVYPISDDNILDSDQKSISINMITEENHQLENNVPNNENHQIEEIEEIDNLEHVSDKELGDIYRRLDKHWSNDPEDRRTSILDDIRQLYDHFHKRERKLRIIKWLEETAISSTI